MGERSTERKRETENHRENKRERGLKKIEEGGSSQIIGPGFWDTVRSFRVEVSCC